ncbi:MAG: inorganic phosphate transporter [Bacteroidota bacterium]
MIESVLFLIVFLLAFSNGANDVSKGIATLVGSGAASIQRATVWGVVTTALGSVAAIVFGGLLLKVFSRGVLADGFDPARTALAVAAGSASWVLVASRLGWPVSTTHAIVGAIIGAGMASVGSSGISWSGVEKKALVPLVVSPFVSFVISYYIFPFISKRFALSKEKCLCIEQCEVVPAPSAFAFSIPVVSIVAGDIESCPPASDASFQMKMTDSLHFFSSGLTSFARGLNDTPKMAALLLGVQALGAQSNLFAYILVGIGIIVGGMIGGRKVIETLSQRITSLEPVEGFVSNAITATLVVTGSIFGLPFSTTHVSTSSIVGIGVASGNGVQWKVVRDILLAWLVTLPSAGIAAYGIQKLL